MWLQEAKSILKSYLQHVVCYNDWPDITLSDCCTNNGRFKAQPASFPLLPLLTEAIFQDMKVPLQNMEHRRGSWGGCWRNYFSLWDFMMSLLARNCCCAHTIQDTDVMPFYLNLYIPSHIYEKSRVWRASENRNYRFNIKTFKYFMTDWGKQINLPCSKQLCLSSQDPNTKHEWWSMLLGAGFSEVLKSHKFH